MRSIIVKIALLWNRDVQVEAAMHSVGKVGLLAKDPKRRSCGGIHLSPCIVAPILFLFVVILAHNSLLGAVNRRKHIEDLIG